MPKHMLKLLALLTVFTVAPATANRLAATVPSAHHHACPHERAAAARNAAIVAHFAEARKAPTRITLIDRVTIRDSLSELGGGGTAMMRP